MEESIVVYVLCTCYTCVYVYVCMHCMYSFQYQNLLLHAQVLKPPCCAGQLGANERPDKVQLRGCHSEVGLGFSVVFVYISVSAETLTNDDEL